MRFELRFFILNICLYVVFATIYGIIYANDENGFYGVSHYGDLVYFSVITQFTVGYGDVGPKSAAAKTVVCLHVLFSFFLNVLELMRPNENIIVESLSESLKAAKNKFRRG